MLYQGLTECQVEQHIDKDNLTMHLHHGRRKIRSLHPGLSSNIPHSSELNHLYDIHCDNYKANEFHNRSLRPAHDATPAISYSDKHIDCGFVSRLPRRCFA